MLVIRDAQRIALRRAARSGFAAWLFAHVNEHFPAQCAEIGEVETRARIEEAIDRAEEYGFTTRRNICRFVDLVFAFGRRFDVEETWAAGILSEAPEMDETVKLEWLHEVGIRRLEG